MSSLNFRPLHPCQTSVTDNIAGLDIQERLYAFYAHVVGIHDFLKLLLGQIQLSQRFSSSCFHFSGLVTLFRLIFLPSDSIREAAIRVSGDKIEIFVLFQQPRGL
ncbi:hypothetical protein [Marinicrinis lubricantis]|uniref:Uncharacterized protein n=1 Tax=Marinicrinis lubricantis TaxID=2086470 RepID=A0ABW1IP61_9BACL